MNDSKKPGLNFTFVVSVAICVLVVLWGVVSSSTFEAAGTTAFNFLSCNFSWFYVLAMTIFVVFSILRAVGL